MTRFNGDLDGIMINKERAVEENRALDHLISAEKEIRREFKPGHDPIFNFEVYTKINKMLREKVLVDVNYDENDLKSFIYSNLNREGTYQDKKTLGFVSGALLEILAERNQRIGKKTIIEIDGNGQKFDYLFNHARNVETLIVRNFSGDFICQDVGSNNGEIGTIALIGIKGHETGYQIASNHGKVENLLLIGNNGTLTGNRVGGNFANIDFLLASENKGEFLLSSLAYSDGKVEEIALVNNATNFSFSSMDFNGGRADTVLIKNTLTDYISLMGREERRYFNEMGIRKILYDKFNFFRTLKLDLSVERFKAKKKIFSLVESIDSNDTAQMLKQVEMIREEYKHFK